jgi:hypothetical protein
MKDFSKFINESEDIKITSKKNTYLLNKNIKDGVEFIESMNDIFLSFKENNNVTSCSISSGFATMRSVMSSYSVNNINLIGVKTAKRTFSEELVPDKYVYICKAIINFDNYLNDSREVPSWTPEVLIYSDKSIDEIIKTYKSIKSLMTRAEAFGAKSFISYKDLRCVSIVFCKT